MFETSVVRAEAKAATGRLSLLSVSVIAHTAIVIGAVTVSIASVDFPAVAPDEYSRAPVFATVQIPPPLGNPNGGRRPDTQPAVKPPAPQPSNQQTAPAIVPDETPQLEAPSNNTGTPTDGPFNPNGTVEGPVGDPDGDPNSIGDPNALPLIGSPNTHGPVAEPVYQPHEVDAPKLIRKVDPRYPASLQRAGMAATVIVRCIIDKNGNVRDAEVVVPASMAPFNAEVLNVLPQWKYKPATLAGRPVDSYLTLTVHFSIKR